MTGKLASIAERQEESSMSPGVHAYITTARRCIIRGI